MAAIDVLGAMYGKRKDAKRVMEAEHRVIINKKLESLDRELGEMVVRAHRLEKTSISRIALEMGCSRTLVYKMIDDYAAVESAFGLIDEYNGKYKWDGENVIVTLTYEQAEEADTRNFGFREDELSAPFKRTFQGYWVYDGPYYEELGSLQNGVFWWARIDANKEELTKWAREHKVSQQTATPTPAQPTPAAYKAPEPDAYYDEPYDDSQDDDEQMEVAR